MSKLITVLIPTYNSYELFIRAASTYINDSKVTIIVSDDSNNIVEKNLIERYCIENKVEYFEGPHKSAGDNWNFLLNKIETPFFILNHHDEYPNNLEFLDFLDPDKIGLIILPCSSKVGNKGLHKIFSWQQKYFSKICLLWPNASLNMILAPTASIIVNSRFKDILFDINLTWYIDADWYQRLFASVLLNKKYEIKFFKYSRVFSLQAENSITSRIRGELKNQIKKEKIYLTKKSLLPKLSAQLFQYLILVLIILITRIKKFINYMNKLTF